MNKAIGFILCAFAIILGGVAITHTVDRSQGLAQASGQLNHAPAGFVSSGDVIQNFSPTATQVKTIPAGGYVNYSTANTTAITFQCLNAGTPAACTVRVGGFATGTETDGYVYPTAGGTVWIGSGVNKIGIKSTAGYTVPVQIQ